MSERDEYAVRMSHLRAAMTPDAFGTLRAIPLSTLDWLAKNAKDGPDRELVERVLGRKEALEEARAER